MFEALGLGLMATFAVTAIGYIAVVIAVVFFA
jgi:hypothetical protein